MSLSTFKRHFIKEYNVSPASGSMTNAF
ncbi:hypothetical protein [Bizionia sp.]